MFRGHRILPRTPEEAALSQPELAFRRAIQMSSPKLRTDARDDVQRALDGLVSDFGSEAAQMASYWAVSAWWGEQHGLWGHQDASAVHSDFGDTIRGRPSWLSQQPPEQQEAIRERASAAYLDWENAGRPGLIEKAESARNYLLSLGSRQQNNSNQKEAV